MADFTFDTLDAVPEDLREFAKERDGKLTVSVAPKVRLDEFRQNNINVVKERDELKSRFARYVELVGEDPDEFRKGFEELQALRKKVDDKELVANSSFDSALEQRTKELRADLEAKAEALAKDRDAWKGNASTYEQKYKQTLIDRAITDAIVNPKSGARPDAIPDILKRAYDVWKVDSNGRIVAYEGDAVMYGSDGASPMQPIEWLSKLRERAPYFFKESAGGGAQGGYNANLGADLSGLSPVEKMKLARQGRV